jgi:hypothetical protein
MGGGRVWPRLTSVALSLQLGLSCAPRRAVRLHPRPQASRRLRLHPRRRHGPGGCGGASTSGKGTCAVSGFRGGSQPGSGFVVAATSALPPPPYRHRSSIGAGQDAAVHHAAVHGAEAGHEEGRAHRPPRHRRLPDVARRQLGEGWVEVRCRPYAPAPCYSVRASRGCLMQLARVLNGRRITSPPPFRVCLVFFAGPQRSRSGWATASSRCPSPRPRATRPSCRSTPSSTCVCAGWVAAASNSSANVSLCHHTVTGQSIADICPPTAIRRAASTPCSSSPTRPSASTPSASTAAPMPATCSSATRRTGSRTSARRRRSRWRGWRAAAACCSRARPCR